MLTGRPPLARQFEQDPSALPSLWDETQAEVEALIGRIPKAAA